MNRHFQLIGLLLLFSSSEGNSIAVFDHSNMVYQVQQIARMVEQIEQLRYQLEQARQQYKALTGIRGFGEMFYNPALQEALPMQWQKVYESLRSDYYQKILDEEHYSGSIEEMQNYIQDRTQRTIAINKSMGMRAYEGSKDRLKQIEKLMNQINQTQDPKSIYELQSRIAIEQSILLNDITKLQLVSQLQKAEKQLIKQQKEEMSKRILNPNNTKIPKIK